MDHCHFCTRPAGLSGLVKLGEGEGGGHAHPMCLVLHIVLETLEQIDQKVAASGDPLALGDPSREAIEHEIYHDLEAFARLSNDPDVVVYSARRLSGLVNSYALIRGHIADRRREKGSPGGSHADLGAAGPAGTRH